MGNQFEAQIGIVAGQQGHAGGVNGHEYEAGDSPDGLLKDELAAKLRGCGCPARDALRYVDAVLLVFQARDREATRGLVAGESISETLVRMEASTTEMLRCIEDAKQPKLEARINRIARGEEMGREISMRKLADAYGLSVEAISKRVDECQRKFCLPKNHFNKSAEACATYRVGNRRNTKNEASS